MGKETSCLVIAKVFLVPWEWVMWTWGNVEAG